MLVSHYHKFIYLKTRKTASTSVEGLLEELCAPPGHVPRHRQSEIRTEFGYIAGRAGGENPNDFLGAHASAEAVRKKLGDDIFKSYRKIYVIRNPYDKVVSWFWHVMPRDTAEELANDFPASRKLFRNWILMRPQMNIDKQFYKTKSGVFDAFRIYYEDLETNLGRLAAEIGANIDFSTLPQWKRGGRQHARRHYLHYYDPETLEKVNMWFKFDFQHFGYQVRSSHA